eukprot:5210427-Pyramimonas_sp.AAC.1
MGCTRPNKATRSNPMGEEGEETDEEARLQSLAETQTRAVNDQDATGAKVRHEECSEAHRTIIR